jgi:hypothetical protein
MKKSEMVDNIACILVSQSPYPQAIDIYKIERLSKMILEEIEKSGMKPPLTKRCPVLLTPIHTWENEQNEA